MRAVPELFDRRLKARSLAYVFVAGAALGLTTLAFPHPEQVMELQLYLLAALAVAIAALFYLRADWIAEWHLQAALAAGTLILTFANYYVGPTVLYPIMYSWIALYAFYFFSLRTALAHVAFIAAAYFVLLLIQDPASPVTRWLLAVGTPTVAGLLISELLGRVREEGVRAQDRSEALAQNEARTRLILESAPDAFIAIDGEGKVTRWNRAAERMFGWPATEAIGQQLRELIFSEEEKAAHDERRRSLLENPDPVTVLQVDTELRRRDGSLFPAEETISRVRREDEVVISAFVRDVSERRRRQEERETLLREQAARAEAERMARMVSDLQHLVDATIEHQTLDEIVPELVVRVRGVLQAEAVTIFLVDEEGGRLEVVASSLAGGGTGEVTSLAMGEGFAGWVAEERRPALLNDPSPEELVHPALREAGLVSLIGAPLLARGRLTGVIQVGTTERRFSEEDLGLLRLAAERVALAISHARVYEREHRIAETLQRSLLPDRLPQPPGLAVDGRYLPAAAEAEVGGDWYDLILVPGGRVGLVMGDVAGKGLAAASMVGRLRSALRAYALEGHEPAVVMERLNRLVWNELEESEMATLIYAVVDPAESTVTWVNAGHMPPLLVVDERLPHFLEGARSVPLGVLPFPSFEESSMRMEPGAAVLLYTDGLIERPGTHIDDGLALLAEAVREAPGSPGELCDHLLRKLVPAEGTTDDVALLALQNTPISDRFSAAFPTEPESLANMRSLLRRWLRHAEGNEQEIAEITTACGEAATNAIEHAGSGGGTPFEVGGELNGGEVAITVRDFGAWRTPRDGDQGRGLSLMRALMDSVEVSPGAQGTIVELRRRLNGRGGGDGA